mmetsp:Transcript_18513/g.43739  ORF Transcript_18513/g.43739 Transcript_18513/m.43739 type:complete len:80 (+) Transcript_18513:137-376(+)
MMTGCEGLSSRVSTYDPDNHHHHHHSLLRNQDSFIINQCRVMSHDKRCRSQKKGEAHPSWLRNSSHSTREHDTMDVCLL